MPRAFSPAIGVLIATAFAVQGCDAMNQNALQEKFHPQQSTKEAKLQLASWIPESATLADAVKTLESRGFECQETQPAAADVRAAMLCTFRPTAVPPPAQRETAPPTPVHWFVTLNSNDGTKISGILVGRTPRDLGG